MNEADWNDWSDPDAMFYALRDSGRGCDRGFRLFAASCCRRAWHLLPDERSRQAVEAVERYADGQAGTRELRRAGIAAEKAAEAIAAKGPLAGVAAANSAAFAALQGPITAERSAAYAAEKACAAAFFAAAPPDALASASTRDAERAEQCRLLRCIFGPLPFREVRIDSSLLTQNDGLLPKLARAAYEDRALPAGVMDNARLLVLADALEEAGLPDAEVLTHLRSGGPHVRGCWAVDVVLGQK